MNETNRRPVPESHPIRGFFQTLTERGMEQIHVYDADTNRYLTNLLIDFVDIERLHPLRRSTGERPAHLFDILEEAASAQSTEIRRRCHKHLGDWTLFHLGLYPESLTYGRRSVSPSFYAAQGRRSYDIVAALDTSRNTVIFRKLAVHFEQCVLGLNWVKTYINDPFYQYVFREFEVT